MFELRGKICNAVKEVLYNNNILATSLLFTTSWEQAQENLTVFPRLFLAEGTCGVAQDG